MIDRILTLALTAMLYVFVYYLLTTIAFTIYQSFF